MTSVLVTGATGNVGSHVLRELLSKGATVKAAVLDPANDAAKLGAGVEPVRFSFGEEHTYAPAFAGVDAVFLLRPPQISDAKHLINPAIDAAKAAGVRAVTFLSVQGAHTNPFVPHHAIEKHLENSGLEYTFLRAAFFMQNLSGTHRDDIRVHNDIMVPAGSGHTAFVDVRHMYSRNSPSRAGSVSNALGSGSLIHVCPLRIKK